MAEFVVEFGQDEPPPADGRLDAAAFHRNHQPIWSVLAPFLAGQDGRCAGGRQRHRPACGGIRRAQPGHHLVAQRLQREASREHRRLAAPFEAPEHPPAPAHRSPRSRLAPAARRKPDGRRAAGDPLRQCHPYRALADRRESAGRCGAPAAARRPAVPLRALHARRAAYRRPAMPSSTRRSGPAIPTGACAISPISAPSPIAWACGSRRSPRCRRII